jgi:hypothetical protein
VLRSSFLPAPREKSQQSHFTCFTMCILEYQLCVKHIYIVARKEPAARGGQQHSVPLCPTLLALLCVSSSTHFTCFTMCILEYLYLLYYVYPRVPLLALLCVSSSTFTCFTMCILEYLLSAAGHLVQQLSVPLCPTLLVLLCVSSSTYEGALQDTALLALYMCPEAMCIDMYSLSTCQQQTCTCACSI